MYSLFPFFIWKRLPSTEAWLSCPYSEKDEAKALGARWNAEVKKWYVPAGCDSTSFGRWLPGAKKSPIYQSPKKQKVEDHSQTNLYCESNLSPDMEYESFASWKESYIKSNSRMIGLLVLCERRLLHDARVRNAL